jgi:cytochrome c oxidase subunit 3
VVFIVSDALTFSGFLAAYGFLDLNLLKHGHWPMKCLHFPFMHGVSAPMYYVALMTFILIFSVTMVLAVDAGHQMKKIKLFSTCFNYHRWWGLRWVSLGVENFIKGEYGAIETKGGSLLQFVDKDGKRVASIAATLPEVRERQRENGLWKKVLCHLTL